MNVGEKDRENGENGVDIAKLVFPSVGFSAFAERGHSAISLFKAEESGHSKSWVTLIYA